MCLFLAQSCSQLICRFIFHHHNVTMDVWNLSMLASIHYTFESKLSSWCWSKDGVFHTTEYDTGDSHINQVQNILPLTATNLWLCNWLKNFWYSFWILFMCWTSVDLWDILIFFFFPACFIFGNKGKSQGAKYGWSKNSWSLFFFKILFNLKQMALKLSSFT